MCYNSKSQNSCEPQSDDFIIISRFGFYRNGGNITHRRGYLSLPSFPSNNCKYTNDKIQDSQLCDAKNAKNDKETNLLQAPVFCESPVGHDESSNCDKYITGNGLRSNVEAQPLVDLCCIIGTSDDIEKKAAWDLVSTFSSRSAKIPQYNMAIEIRNLTKYPEPKPDLHLKVTHRCI